MSVSPGFRAFLLDQLGQVAAVTGRPMMGGITYSVDGLAFALAAEDRVYFKVDDSNREDFVAEGMGPFLPFGDPARPMQYYELPVEVLEDPEQLRIWVNRALAVAARKGKRKPRPKTK